MASDTVATGSVLLTPKFDNLSESIKSAFDGSAVEGAGKEAGADYTEAAAAEIESSTSIGSAVSSVFTAVAATVAAAATATAAGVAAIAKSSLDLYADYEQLVGGVETLYGDSSDAMLEYAATAYKTAGLSANEYMETATGFAASLVSSLGGDTEAAVEYADLAITDMSDNANKMGTDIESIQNAYAGFAKQNYTMLDNLKLGYAGTTEGMEELIADANELKEAQGETGDLTIDSYADIVEAIHLVQEEMGITGTTAAEAAETISGSISSAQAAWDNWLVGLADDDADISGLTSELVESVVTAADNIVPRVGQILGSIGTVLVEELPGIIGTLAATVGELAPGFAEACSTLLASLGGAVTAYLPQALAAVDGLISGLAAAVTEGGPDMLAGAGEFFGEIGSALVEYLPAIVGSVAELVTSLASALIEGAPGFFAGAVELLGELVGGIDSMLPEVIAGITGIMSQLIASIIDNGPEMLTQGSELIWQLCVGISGLVGDVLGAATEVMADAIEYFLGLPDDALTWGVDLIQGIIDGIGEMAGSAVEAVSGVADDIASSVCEFFGIASPSTLFAGYGADLMLGLQDGVDGESSGTTETALSAVNSLTASIDSALSSFSPSLSGVMSSLTSSVSSGMASAQAALSAGLASMSTSFTKAWTAMNTTATSGITKLVTTVKTVKTKIVSVFSGASSWLSSAGTNIIKGLVNSIKSGLSSVTSAIKNVCKNAISAAKSALGISSPSKVFAEIGEYTMQGLALGIADGVDTALAAASSATVQVAAASLPAAGAGAYVGAGATATTNIYIDGIQASPESQLYGLLGQVVATAEVARVRGAC